MPCPHVILTRAELAGRATSSTFGKWAVGRYCRFTMATGATLCRIVGFDRDAPTPYTVATEAPPGAVVHTTLRLHLVAVGTGTRVDDALLTFVSSKPATPGEVEAAFAALRAVKARAGADAASLPPWAHPWPGRRWSSHARDDAARLLQDERAGLGCAVLNWTVSGGRPAAVSQPWGGAIPARVPPGQHGVIVLLRSWLIQEVPPSSAAPLPPARSGHGSGKRDGGDEEGTIGTKRGRTHMSPEMEGHGGSGDGDTRKRPRLDGEDGGMHGSHGAEGGEAPSGPPPFHVPSIRGVDDAGYGSGPACAKVRVAGSYHLAWLVPPPATPPAPGMTPVPGAPTSPDWGDAYVAASPDDEGQPALTACRAVCAWLMAGMPSAPRLPPSAIVRQAILAQVEVDDLTALPPPATTATTASTAPGTGDLTPTFATTLTNLWQGVAAIPAPTPTTTTSNEEAVLDALQREAAARHKAWLAALPYQSQPVAGAGSAATPHAASGAASTASTAASAPLLLNAPVQLFLIDLDQVMWQWLGGEGSSITPLPLRTGWDAVVVRHLTQLMSVGGGMRWWREGAGNAGDLGVPLRDPVLATLDRCQPLMPRPMALGPDVTTCLDDGTLAPVTTTLAATDAGAVSVSTPPPPNRPVLTAADGCELTAWAATGDASRILGIAKYPTYSIHGAGLAHGEQSLFSFPRHAALAQVCTAWWLARRAALGWNRAPWPISGSACPTLPVAPVFSVPVVVSDSVPKAVGAPPAVIAYLPRQLSPTWVPAVAPARRGVFVSPLYHGSSWQGGASIAREGLRRPVCKREAACLAGHCDCQMEGLGVYFGDHGNAHQYAARFALFDPTRDARVGALVRVEVDLGHVYVVTEAACPCGCGKHYIDHHGEWNTSRGFDTLYARDQTAARLREWAVADPQRCVVVGVGEVVLSRG